MAEPATLAPVRIGCSGWNYRSWRGGFYPPGLGTQRWLGHYATILDTVEVNSTFYRLASSQAVARWVAQTPEGFLFTLKASRYLTHFKRLADLGPGIDRFYERIEPLVASPKLGPLLWQLPESFHRDDDRLAAALTALPAGLHCFEFRHPSWFSAPVYDLLRAHSAALVIGDDPRRPFQSHELTTDWTIVRFHFGARGRRGNYSAAELAQWARRIHDWRSEVTVLAYFNNDWEGFAPRNAVGLCAALTRLETDAGTGAPPVRQAKVLSAKCAPRR